MMSKLTAQDSNQNKPLKPRSLVKVKGGDKQEIIMIKEIIKIDTDKKVENRRMTFRGRAQYRQNFERKVTIC